MSWPRDLRAGRLPSGAGASGGDPKARRRQAAVGHPDGARPGGPAGGQDRARTDLRGRLPAVLVSGSARSGRPRTRWRRSGWRFLEGEQFVFEADIRISSARSITRGCWSWSVERVSDRRVLKLLRQWLRAGVLVEGVRPETVTGHPAGRGDLPAAGQHLPARASTRAWAEYGTGELVRYADDFVVLCRPAAKPSRLRAGRRRSWATLGLELHPDKTRVVDLREGKEGFDFLGCHFHARMSGRLWEQQRIVRYYLHRWPSQRSMKRARLRVKALTGRSRVGIGVARRDRGL